MQEIDRHRSKGKTVTDSEIPEQRSASAGHHPQPFAPVRITTKRDKPVDTIVLFYLDDVPYSVPAKVPAAYVVGLLRDLRTSSEGAAVARIMTRLLGGDQAMRDLEEAEGLEIEQLNDILDVVKKMALAAASKATGK
jgi:hypothetical protein